MFINDILIVIITKLELNIALAIIAHFSQTSQLDLSIMIHMRE